MKAKHALNKLAALGFQMKHETPGASYNHRYRGDWGGYRVILNTQYEDVSTLRAHPVSDQDDSQSDYLAGSYFDSIPQLARYVGSLREKGEA